jgi:alkylation response protein AidB-like acyl-CoA dehydrogenase
MTTSTASANLTRSLTADPVAGGADWDDLTARYRPVIRDIAEGNLAREHDRVFPYQQVRELIDAGFSRIRIPVEHGGDAATLNQTFALLAELAEADPNVAHVFRNHLAFVEDRLNDPDSEATAVWLQRFRDGEFVGGGWTEASTASFDKVGTKIRTVDGVTTVTGDKFYATGSLYADWLDVIGRNEQGELYTALVRREQDGVEVPDDWPGFGQQTTASGSATYRDAVADDNGLFPARDRYIYQGIFYQTAILAVLVGITRAAFRDGVENLRARRRNYPLGTADRPAYDPVLQEKVGQLSTQVYQAGAALDVQTRTLDHLAALLAAGGDVTAVGTPAAEAFRETTVQTHQAQSVVVESALDVTSRIFDALGASATYRQSALDRHWRNARTLSSHNPRAFKERILGDYFVNGAAPQGDSPFGSDQGQGV